MTAIERLREMLGALSLTALDAKLEALPEQASKKEPSDAGFLLETLEAEVDARRQRYLKTRLQLAHPPEAKTFEQLGFSVRPSIDERQLRELRTLRFIHETSSVILLGPLDPETFGTFCHVIEAKRVPLPQSGRRTHFLPSSRHVLCKPIKRRVRSVCGWHAPGPPSQWSHLSDQFSGLDRL